jgi:ABC-type transporter Mla maintaining outer membrane lipid asymmetry ATPase subunit MlaF
MPTALAVCDDIILLHAGKVRARITAEVLRTNPNHIVNRFMQGLVKLEELENVEQKN